MSEQNEEVEIDLTKLVESTNGIEFRFEDGYRGKFLTIRDPSYFDQNIDEIIGSIRGTLNILENIINTDLDEDLDAEFSVYEQDGMIYTKQEIRGDVEPQPYYYGAILELIYPMMFADTVGMRDYLWEMYIACDSMIEEVEEE